MGKIADCLPHEREQASCAFNMRSWEGHGESGRVVGKVGVPPKRWEDTRKVRLNIYSKVFTKTGNRLDTLKYTDIHAAMQAAHSGRGPPFLEKPIHAMFNRIRMC